MRSGRTAQHGIDQRFYRRKYDATKMLATFGSTLRSEVELERPRAHLVGAVEETLQPTHVSLWRRPPERRGRPRT